MKAIPGELKHSLVVADIDKKNRDCNKKDMYREKKDKLAQRFVDQKAT